MKKVIFIFTMLAAVWAGTFFTSCDSPTQNAADAKANVQDAKQDLKNAQQESAAAELKAASAEEWKAFKTETDVVIRDNEIRIAELKEKMKKTGKVVDAAYAENIAALEQKNRDMKARVDGYEKSQNGWDEFKREFNHDMDELGQALKDLTVNNKK